MTFEIHRAEIHEAGVLSGILQEAAAFKLSRGDDLWGRYGFTVAEVQDTISEGSTYIATVDQEPAGSVRLLWEDVRIWGPEKGTDDQAAYIHRLTVRDQFRGTGTARKIIEWAGNQAETAGRPYLRLDCSSSNEGLCAYYKKLGFKAVGTLVLPSGYDPALFQKEV